MNPNKNLEEPLINQIPNKEFEITCQKPFQPFNDEINPLLITKKNLTDLFLPDNIRDGVSYKIITGLNGIGSILNQLKTNIDTGITVKNLEELEERKIKYGKNDPVIKPLKSLWFFIKESLQDFMLRVLIVAAIVALIVGMIEEGVEKGWMEGTAIIFAIFIVVAVSSFNNYLKEKQFAKLNAEEELRDVTVTRDNEIQQICIYGLLVGDILHIATGDIIPVDGVLVQGNKIKMDESSVTGESDLIVKSDFQKLNEDYTSVKAKKETPFLISGSKVMEGTGKILVCAVGIETQIGQLKLKLTEDNEPTPLQLKLETVADQIGRVGLYTAVVTVCVMTIHLIIEVIIEGPGIKGVKHLLMHMLSEIIGYFLIGITVVVVAVPEGLPLAVTIALAYSVGRMKKENNFVKHLSSCEIMGGANNICSDKTGTLTQNKMTVMNLYISKEDHSGSYLTSKNIDPFTFNIFVESVCINSDANPRMDASTNFFEHLGNKTECALLELCLKMGVDYKKFRPSPKIVRILPFSSKTKRMTTVYEYAPGKFRIYSKGASEIMLDVCKDVLMKENEIVPLTKEDKDIYKENVIENYARKALRTISLAYREVNNGELDVINCSEEELESYFTLIAIAGVMDPLRPEIKEAVSKCKSAGITVRMVTGDNLTTAIAIAKESGILSKEIEDYSVLSNDFYVMEGFKFREMVGGLVYACEEDEKARKNPKIKNMEVFKSIADHLRVLARSTPEDKYILVTGLKLLNNVVAVTGDGTNDAPALKKADVGFAMGIAGTLVAKQAAGIILLDDNFKSIVTACKWGRNIYDSIRKFIQFQLTINIVALFMAFLGGAITKQSPLNAIQMLWVNLIMDTFASLALATEPPNDSLLDRPPYTRNESIVTPTMWRNILGQSIFQIIIMTIILFLGPELFGIQSSFNMGKIWDEEKGRHYTIFFQSFVFLQLFNEINCRKLKRTEYNVFSGFFNNWLFIVIEILTAIVQIAIVQFGGEFIRTTPLTWDQHLICMGIGAFSLLNGLFVKILPESLFKKIKLLKEEEMAVAQLDRSLTSKLKRKASARLHSSFQT